VGPRPASICFGAEPGVQRIAEQFRRVEGARVMHRTGMLPLKTLAQVWKGFKRTKREEAQKHQ